MKLREVVTADGEIWIDENYADRYKRYTHTFVPDDELGSFSMYDGYYKVSPSLSVPGVPIFSRFEKVDRWSVFQPATYRLSNVYHYKSAEVRGTLGLENASAYHVIEVGTFYSDENKRKFYETPNTPCVVKRRDGVVMGTPSFTNEPARFIGHDTFLLTTDVSTFGDKLNADTDVLAFINDKPEIVHARVYGLVSASFFNHVIIAPLVPTVNASFIVSLTKERELELVSRFVSEASAEPPETAMITGSTSGTITVHFEKEVLYYKYALNFGDHEYYLAFRHGWLYRGFTKPGDSGGPLFRIPSRE